MKATPDSGSFSVLTYANGGYVDNDNGHLSSNGLYTTDDKGEIRISGITGTVVVKETKPAPGYVIDQSTQTQTVTVNPLDTQTLTEREVIAAVGSAAHIGAAAHIGGAARGDVGGPAHGSAVHRVGAVFHDDGLRRGIENIAVRHFGLGDHGATNVGGSANVGGGTNGGNDLTFENDPKSRLIIEKYITGTTTPLKGVTFLVTESNGTLLGSANGEYTTDE